VGLQHGLAVSSWTAEAMAEPMERQRVHGERGSREGLRLDRGDL